MALTLASSSSADIPAKTLQNALASFRSILKEDERQRLDQLLADPAIANENSVMVLVAEIDSQNSTRFSRYVGPKLQPVLDAVQQFSSIVDTFIAFGPMIGQIVWGSVKVTLLLVNSFTEYFQKLAAFFQSIADTCPRLREFGGLYQSSDSLQGCLCLYFAGIIQVCEKALKFSRHSGIVQFSKAAFMPFDREFGDVKDNLTRLAKIIADEVILASSKVQVQEAKLEGMEREFNSGFRKMMTKFSSKAAQELADVQRWCLDAEKRQLEKDRATIRRNLSPLDHAESKMLYGRFRKQCLTGTSTWFKDSNSFSTWLQSEDSAVLWYPGKMGCGKTILCSNLIAHITILNKPQHTISYFFCQNEVPASLSARNVVGSLCSQIFETYLAHVDGELLKGLLLQSATLDTEDVVNFVIPQCKLRRQHFLIVDGLDQCRENEITDIIKALKLMRQTISEGSCLKIFVSSRPDVGPSLERHLGMSPRLEADPCVIQRDVATYIEAGLKMKHEDGDLRVEEDVDLDTLLEGIKDILTTGAEGWFLWVYLVIEELCLHEGLQGILETLEDIPPTLSGMFDQLLESVLNDSVACATSCAILQWVAGAKRPLKIEELREAITIQPGQTSLNHRALKSNIRRNIASCHGLVVVDEDESTVHLIHHSFLDHLLSPAINKKTPTYRFDPAELNENHALLCMTYLRFADFERHLVKTYRDLPSEVGPLDIATKAIDLGSGPLPRIARAKKLLQGVRHSSSEPQGDSRDLMNQQLKILSEMLQKSKVEAHAKDAQLKFIEYARVYWIRHARALKPDLASRSWRLFCTLVESNTTHFDKAWEVASEPEFLDEDSIFLFREPNYTRDALKLIGWATRNDNPALLYCKFPKLSDDKLTVAWRFYDKFQEKRPWKLVSEGPELLPYDPIFQALRRTITLWDEPEVGLAPIKANDNFICLEQLLSDVTKALIPQNNAEFAVVVCHHIQRLACDIVDSRQLTNLTILLSTLYNLPHNLLSIMERWVEQPSFIWWSLEVREAYGFKNPDPPKLTSVDGRSNLAKYNEIVPFSLRRYSSNLNPMELAILLEHPEVFDVLLHHAVAKEYVDHCKPSILLAGLYGRMQYVEKLWETVSEHALWPLSSHTVMQYIAWAVSWGGEQFALYILRRHTFTDMQAIDSHVDEAGNSALMYAAEFGTFQVFCELLSRGASLLQSNTRLTSPQKYLRDKLDYWIEGSEEHAICSVMISHIPDLRSFKDGQEELARLFREDLTHLLHEADKTTLIERIFSQLDLQTRGKLSREELKSTLVSAVIGSSSKKMTSVIENLVESPKLLDCKDFANLVLNILDRFLHEEEMDHRLLDEGIMHQRPT